MAEIRDFLLLALLLATPATGSVANVVTDWDEKAVSWIQTGTLPPPPTSFRAMAIVHIAMFDAVNSIEPRYKPHLVRLTEHQMRRRKRRLRPRPPQY